MSLAQALSPFVNEQATPRVKEQRLSQEIQVPAPRVEAFMSSPGTVSFRFLDQLDPRMHRALYEAGLVDEPPETIVLDMVIEPAPRVRCAALVRSDRPLGTPPRCSRKARRGSEFCAQHERDEAARGRGKP